MSSEIIPHSKPSLGNEEKKAVCAVLESGQIAQGVQVEAFEKSLCEWTGRKFAVAVSSGTTALSLSLTSFGIKKGDEVICPSYSCTALLYGIEGAGARAVLADIDLEDFNLSPEKVKKKITRKTKAVLVPHAFGRSARIHEILKLGVPVLEDGTQALGASAKGQKVGSFGAASLFSFYATKMITTGEGGMILTDNRKMAEHIRDLRDYDKKEKYQSGRMNAKMTDIEAVIGIEQMKKLPSFIEKRRRMAYQYHQALAKMKVHIPSEDWERDHVYYRYVVRVPRKAGQWIDFLQAEDIDVKKPVFKPLHAYQKLSGSSFPGTSQAFQEAVSLPLFPDLSESDLQKVCRAVEHCKTNLSRKTVPAEINHA